MRLLGLYRTFMTGVRPIIWSGVEAHVLACDSQTKVPMPGFTGPE
jgi:hypothetical protein